MRCQTKAMICSPWGVDTPLSALRCRLRKSGDTDLSAIHAVATSDASVAHKCGELEPNGETFDGLVAKAADAQASQSDDTQAWQHQDSTLHTRVWSKKQVDAHHPSYDLTLCSRHTCTSFSSRRRLMRRLTRLGIPPRRMARQVRSLSSCACTLSCGTCSARINFVKHRAHVCKFSETFCTDTTHLLSSCTCMLSCGTCPSQPGFLSTKRKGCKPCGKTQQDS